MVYYFCINLFAFYWLNDAFSLQRQLLHQQLVLLVCNVVATMVHINAAFGTIKQPFIIPNQILIQISFSVIHRLLEVHQLVLVKQLVNMTLKQTFLTRSLSHESIKMFLCRWKISMAGSITWTWRRLPRLWRFNWPKKCSNNCSQNC